MQEYLEKLKSKFNYSSELIDFLSKAIPAIIAYYGEDKKDVILEAFLNCEIHIQRENENPKKYLNAYLGTENEWDLPILAGAFYHNEITVKDNEVNAKPIIYFRTMFVGKYHPFDFNDDSKLDALLHEMCHMVKGYGHLKVKDGKIIDSSGLLKEIYSYDTEHGLTREKTEYIGIEEGINVFDATVILSMITGREQKFRGYKNCAWIAKLFMEHKEIADVIRKSQFNGCASSVLNI